MSFSFLEILPPPLISVPCCTGLPCSDKVSEDVQENVLILFIVLGVSIVVAWLYCSCIVMTLSILQERVWRGKVFTSWNLEEGRGGGREKGREGEKTIFFKPMLPIFFPLGLHSPLSYDLISGLIHE